MGEPGVWMAGAGSFESDRIVLLKDSVISYMESSVLRGWTCKYAPALKLDSGSSDEDIHCE